MLFCFCYSSQNRSKKHQSKLKKPKLTKYFYFVSIPHSLFHLHIWSHQLTQLLQDMDHFQQCQNYQLLLFCTNLFHLLKFRVPGFELDPTEFYQEFQPYIELPQTPTSNWRLNTYKCKSMNIFSSMSSLSFE